MHNETAAFPARPAPRRYAAARIRYAAGSLRYAGVPVRYADAGLRYAETRLRYAAGQSRYAEAGLRYAVGRIRYARRPPRYAAASIRYAGGLFRYAAGGFRVKWTRRRADARDMLVPRPPMTNAERQRQFRKRNPGYYGRLHARRRAAVRALSAQLNAAAQAMAARREPLMLPAPVEAVEIPGMTIPAIGAVAAMHEPVALPVSCETTIPPLAARRG